MTLNHSEPFANTILVNSDSGNNVSSSSDDSFYSALSDVPLHSLLNTTFSTFPKNFNVVHINAQSIPSHFPDFLDTFNNNNIHAVLVSESFLKPSLPSTSYCLPGFHLIRNDRTGKGGGGVAIYLRSHIPFRILDKSPSQYTESSEHIFIEVIFGQLKVLLAVFYSPSLHINYFDAFESLIDQYIPTVDHTIIMGDFNTCLIKNDYRTRRIKGIINSFNLKLLPTKATHFSPNCVPSLLDLMIVSSSDHVDAYGQFPAEAFSYHDLIYLSYKIRPPKAKPSIVMRRSFQNFDNDNFMRDLNNIDWAAVFNASSIDDKLNIFNSLVTELFDVYAPFRRVKIKHLPAPWLTHEIRVLMNKRNAAKGKYKLNPSEANRSKYKKLRNRCCRICRDAQREYIHSSVDDKNSSTTWRFLRSLGIGRQQYQNFSHGIDLESLNKHFTTTVTIDRQVKDSTINSIRSLPNHHFPPFHFNQVSSNEILTHILAVRSDAIGSDGISRRMIIMTIESTIPILHHILNHSLTSGTFPAAWRKAYVVPIPKIPNPSCSSHYRPISILPFLSKVLERIVHRQLSIYLARNNLLSSSQSGFRHGHSTVTALIKVCDDIRCAVDNKLLTVISLLDFSNAFNTVDFELLLTVLESTNMSTNVVNWFRAYLCNRQQCVLLDSRFSSYSPLTAGVPQGAVLSPLLFSIFINSISSVISSSYHLYADDLQIYLTTGVDNITDAIEALNADLHRIATWCRSYGLMINPSKSQVAIMGSTRQLSKLANVSLPPIVLDSTIIPISSSVKNLGLIIDSSMSWVPYVNEISRKIFATMRHLRRWKNFLPIKTKTALAKSLLLPILDYADACYLDLSETMLNKLERLQNVCIRFIFGIRKFDHVSQYRRQLKWLPIRSRRNLHALSLLYSVLFHPQTPGYLKERFCFLGSDDQSLVRSQRVNKLKFPQCHTKTYSNSFTAKTVTLWNALPTEIRQSESIKIFKSRLKEHYLSII